VLRPPRGESCSDGHGAGNPDRSDIYRNGKRTALSNRDPSGWDPYLSSTQLHVGPHPRHDHADASGDEKIVLSLCTGATAPQCLVGGELSDPLLPRGAGFLANGSCWPCPEADLAISSSWARRPFAGRL